VSEQLVADYQDAIDYEGFKFELIRTFGFEPPFSEDEFIDGKLDNITQQVYTVATNEYKGKSELIAQMALPVIKEVYEKAGEKYKNIAVPVTDGVKTLNVLANLQKSYETEGREVALSIEKGITLAIIDDSWKDHLREMDDLKQSVQHAVYEQKDPLLIYKFESFELFKQMILKVNKDVISFLVKARLPIKDSSQVTHVESTQKTDMSKLQTGRTDFAAGGPRAGQKKAEPVRVEKKTGRNEPCPCGSGKKYKHCHGR